MVGFGGGGGGGFGMPKRAARSLRFSSSVVRVVVGRWEVNASWAGAGSGSFWEVGGAGEGAGGETFRSEVWDGLIAVVWLGTAVGVGTAPRLPAARAAAEAGVDAVALVGDFAGALFGVGSVVVGAAAATVVPSSSQSISSSGARGAVDFLSLAVDFEAGADEGAFLLSSS